MIPYGGSDDRLMAELGIPFDTVKPVELIRPLVASCTSATTSCSTSSPGREASRTPSRCRTTLDGGRRRCISVNIPEPTADGSNARRAGFAKVSDLTYARLVAIAEQLPTAREQGLRVHVLQEGS